MTDNTKAQNTDIKTILERNKIHIMKYRPIDDTFFEVLVKDTQVCEEILKTVLNDENVKVLEVIPQKNLRNLQGRSIRVDALCRLSDQSICNIEVQRSVQEDHLRRSRYHEACITANVTQPGTLFKDVPNVRIVYLSEKDIFKQGKCVYCRDNKLQEIELVADNGVQEIYVNAEVDDGSDISELMKCFLQTEVNHPKFPKLSKRVQYLKYDEEGVKRMCEIDEKIREEGRCEGRKEGRKTGRRQGRQEERRNAIIRMLKKLSVDEIVEIGYDRGYVSRVAKSVSITRS